MRVGDFVRTEYGIAKIIDTKTIDKYNTIIKKHYQDLKYKLDETIIPNFEENEPYCYKEDIIKSSPNIIDLIEVGDYVNGNKVYDIETSYILDENHNRIGEKISLDIGIDMYGYTIYIEEKDIKSILTKEQFESMKYRIESEVN